MAEMDAGRPRCLRPRRALALVALLAVALGSAASPAAEPRPLAERLAAYLGAWHRVGDFSGCAAIERRGETATSCVGLADHDFGIANRPQTRFRIGSVTKMMTAAAILRLEEMGKLRVEDPLAGHLPGYPRGNEITIHKLLTHRAGMPELYALPEFATRRMFPARPGDWVEQLAGQPLQFEPGTRYAYSNAGYVVLAHLVELLSGRRYGEFLETELFAPLGMEGSGEDDPQRVVPQRATGYDPAGWRGVEPAPYAHPSQAVGAGSLLSTVGDLVRWARAMRAGDGLSPGSWRKLLTDHGDGYGYGVVRSRRLERPVAGHDGREPGFIAAFDLFPEDDAAVVFAANLQTGIGDALRRGLAALAFDERPEEPGAGRPEAAAEPLEETSLAAYAGRYGFGPAMVVTVTARGRRLFARANQSADSELLPVGPAEFFSRATYAGAGFEKSGDGPAEAMLWRQGGGEFRGERFPDGPPDG